MTSQSDPNHSEMKPSSFSQYEPIRNPETQIDPTPSPPPEPIPGFSHQRWWHRIGFSGLLTLGAGTLAILASCAVLIFLWWGAHASRDRREATFWTTIVTRGWAPRVVTICSAAIRTSIVLQAGLIAAAAAALILETSGASFVDIGVLSTERALRSSPANILPAAFRRCAKAGLFGLLHFLIVITALVIILLSTFTSTILLSDFATSRIAAPARSNPTAIAMRDNPISNGASYLKSQPSANWRFAETKLGKPIANWYDTGNIYRALLPIETASSRASLERYEGPAVVINPRTFCAAPEIDSMELAYFNNRLLEWLPPVGSNYTMLFSTVLGGLQLTATASMKLPSSSTTKPETYHLNIDCQLQYIESDQPTSAWPLSLCSGMEYGLYEGMDPLNDDADRLFQQVTLLNSSVGLSEVQFTNQSLTNTVLRYPIPSSLQNLTTKPEGTWTRFYNQSGVEMFSVTSCFASSTAPKIYDVVMTGRAIASEPGLAWRRTANKKQMEEIEKQFGIGLSRTDFEGRGILNLTIVDSSKTGPDAFDPSVAPGLSFMSGNNLEAPPEGTLGTWSMIDDTGEVGYEVKDATMHVVYTSLFQSVLRKTLDPAQAIHALQTRLYQMTYYSWLNQFDYDYPATTVHTTDRLIPVRWIGLIAVLSLILLHFLLVVMTILLFAVRTQLSALGETWPAVAQIVSPETSEVIEMGGETRK